jgi:phage terminase large subunit
MTIDLQTPSCFEPLSQPSRYKASYGGRGSGKSWHFASMVVERCLLNPGSRIVCIREVQKTLNQSAKALIERTIQQLGVGHMFRVKFESIETRRADHLQRYAGPERGEHQRALKAMTWPGLKKRKR